MEYETVIYEKKGPIAHIILNRPEQSNAINIQVTSELLEVCQGIVEDDEVRVVILSGSGDSAFSVGVDPLGSAYAGEATSLRELREFLGNSSAASAVAKLDCPVIAAINGDALGAGLELALSCDIRIASQKARFGLPQILQGLLPWDGGTQRLPRLVGGGKALEMLLTGKTVEAGEALRMGLVNEVISPKELMSQVEDLANRIVSMAPIAVRYIKEAVNKGMDLTLEQGLRLEADLAIILHSTEDRAEGIRAFQEKRRPHLKGR